MIHCQSCSAEQDDASRFCSECGAALAEGLAETMARDEPPLKHASGSSSTTSYHGSYLPGSRIAERYRIVSLVGKGGMGEVYRADDLKLGHPVALKFLPRDLSGDPRRLQFFHEEVRLSRQIAHPNVCRVYDIGEAGGVHYLSMEYIDGEDLRILLRRIGRLPGDKGVEVIRQLAAGLAAAHEKGVLHRDLKPANVMIDGRGQVRVTDFGLAKLVDDESTESVGTPAYMAPEQLARGETSVQSDLYSLGLISYEVMTGKQTYSFESLDDLRRQHEESSPSDPSSVVSDIDPTTERVILRCLERLPEDRPKSAAQVLVALPGGDPLTAAMVAGETPSPEMVAAAGGEDKLAPRTAIGLLLATIALLFACAAVMPWNYPTGWTNLDRPPQELAGIARDLISDLGHDGDIADRAYGFEHNPDVRRNWSRYENDVDQFRIDRARKSVGAISFWYRVHRKRLLNNSIASPTANLGVIGSADPPNDQAGMVLVSLDSQGRLLRYHRVPKDGEPKSGHSSDQVSLVDETLAEEPDLGKSIPRLLDAALPGFDKSQFVTDWQLVPTPSLRPPLYAERLRQWESTTESSRSILVGEREGDVVYFRLTERMAAAEDDEESDLATLAGTVISWVLIAAALLLAWHNLRSGRGDRRGALRIAAFVLIAGIGFAVLSMDNLVSTNRTFEITVGIRLYLAAVLWAAYIAIEPFARRLWPNVLISWCRVLRGRWFDAMVGRDLLVGVLMAAAVSVLFAVGELWSTWRGIAVPIYGLEGNVPLGARATVANLWAAAGDSVGTGVAEIMLLLVVLRLVFRGERLAAFALILVLSSLAIINYSSIITLILNFAIIASVVFVLIRMGLLAMVSLLFAGNLIGRTNWTTDVSSWYFSETLITLACLIALAAFGCYHSMGGRTAFATTLSFER